MAEGLELSDFMGQFRDEAVELLKRLTDGLLKLERDPEDEETLAEVARAAHTLKGNARFMELDGISQIAHRAEDLLVAARDGKLRLTGEATDLMLSCLDDISRLVEAGAKGEEADVDAGAVAARIEASAKELLDKGVPKEEKEEKPPPPRPKPAEKQPPKRKLDPFVTIAAELLGNVRDRLAEGIEGQAVSEISDAAYRLRDAAVLTERSEIGSLADAVGAFLERAEGGLSRADARLLGESVETLDALVNGREPGEKPTKLRRRLKNRRPKGKRRPRAQVPPPGEVKDETAASAGGLVSSARASASPARAEAPEAVKGAPAVSKTPKPPSAAAAAKPVVAETIRVNTSRIDTLVNLVGELVINQRRAAERVSRFKELNYLARESDRLWQTLQKATARGEERKPAQALLTKEELASLVDRYETLSRELREQMARFAKDLGEEANRLTGSTEKLREHATRLRMLPISRVFDTFPRAVRDMAREVGKQVEVEVRGGETELDKKMLEGLSGPLTHLLRNCISHGIETPAERVQVGKPPTGTITISAEQEGDHVLVKVADDGRGINPDAVVAAALKRGLIDEGSAQSISTSEAIGLLFSPGLSTRAAVSDISGRGVGLNAVRQDIENLKGEVSVQSAIGRGTVFTLKLPLTIAILSAVLVSVAGYVYAVPSTYIAQALEIVPSDVCSVEGRAAVITRARTIPLVDLAEILELSGEKRRWPTRLSVLVLQHVKDRVGFVVDSVIGEQELVIKSLGSHLKKVKNVAGAAILSTGEITIILHVPELIASARAAPPKALAEALAKETGEKIEGRVLIVDDSLTARELERSILEGAGFNVEMAVDGVEGLRKVGEGEFDLVLADVLMPRMDGIEMTKRLKSSPRYRSIPVVIVSALDNEVDKRRAAEAGADAFVVKSKLDQKGLLATIAGLTK